jgi:hypothetical protein
VNRLISFFCLSHTCIRQAAASGQPDVSFASEDKNPDDLAREDIRCLIRGLPKVPQEAKAKYRLATSSSNGVHTNCAGLSKVNKLFWSLRESEEDRWLNARLMNSQIH